MSTACGLGNPSNLAPLVQITQPSTETADFSSVGLVSLIAEASDYESGNLSQISWSSDVEGNLGTSAPGAPFLYVPTLPGIKKITARAMDSAGAFGEDSVTLTFNPSPPNIVVLAPSGKVFAGLPTDLIAMVTNLPGLTPEQPCNTSVWTGFQGNTILFDHVNGCSAQATFLNPGAHHVNVSMTVQGLTGTASQPFTVIDDGKLHVKITSPLKDTQLRANFKPNTPITLAAATNVDASTVASYTWAVRQFSNNGQLSNGSTFPTGQSVSFTPPMSLENCGPGVAFRIEVFATDTLGRFASDSTDAFMPDDCITM